MSDYKIYPVLADQVNKVDSLLLPEIVEALKRKLPITAFVAVDKNAAVGAIAGFIDGDTFEIRSLYVIPNHRKKGVGTALIDKLEEVLENVGVSIGVSYTLQNDDNETLCPFFIRRGFIKDKVSYPMYFIGELKNVQIDEKYNYDKGNNILSFNSVRSSLLRAASNEAFKEGKPVPNGGLISLNVEKDISFCVVDDGRIEAYITLEKVSDNMLEVTALWSGLKEPMILMRMLSKLLKTLKDKYNPDTKIAMLALNQKSGKIIDILFTNVRLCSHRFVKV